MATARQVATGEGLQGGGNLASDRTLSLNVFGLTDEAAINSANDYLVFYDSSAVGHRKATFAEMITALQLDEVIENAGALSGAAPAGAQWGIDTTTGIQYYVSGGNWTAAPGGTDTNFATDDLTQDDDRTHDLDNNDHIWNNVGDLQFNGSGTTTQFRMHSGTNVEIASEGGPSADSRFVTSDNGFAFTTDVGFVLNSTTGLQLDPHGTGAGDTTELRFKELTANGNNYVGFKAANNIGASVIWTLPMVDGTSGQVLSTDGSGTLSWATAAGGGGNYATADLTLTGTRTHNFDSNIMLVNNISALIHNAGNMSTTIAPTSFAATYNNGGIINWLQVTSTQVELRADNGAVRVQSPAGLVLDAHGGGAGETTELQFSELGGGGNYVGFKAPDSIAADVMWVLPNTDGTSGQILRTDGAGTLSWVTVAGGSLQNLIETIAGDGGSFTAGTATDTFNITSGDLLRTSVSSNTMLISWDPASLTSGDILVSDGTTMNTLAIGSKDSYLAVTSGSLPEWRQQTEYIAIVEYNATEDTAVGVGEVIYRDSC